MKIKMFTEVEKSKKFSNIFNHKKNYNNIIIIIHNIFITRRVVYAILIQCITKQIRKYYYYIF